VLQRVTSSGEFLISRYFVLFFIMKWFMELRCYFVG
jgi:hypothetical protein